jgi:hypothetical protein
MWLERISVKGTFSFRKEAFIGSNFIPTATPVVPSQNGEVEQDVLKDV